MNIFSKIKEIIYKVKDYDKDEPLAKAGDKVKVIVLRHDE